MQGLFGGTQSAIPCGRHVFPGSTGGLPLGPSEAKPGGGPVWDALCKTAYTVEKTGASAYIMLFLYNEML